MASHQGDGRIRETGYRDQQRPRIEDYTKIMNQMIFYGGEGVFFQSDTRLHTANGKAFVVHPEFVNDFENDDYNNAYYNVTVLREE